MKNAKTRYDYKVSVHRNNIFTLFLADIVFRITKCKIKRTTSIECERIGSSDIKGVYSKPIIDIMVSEIDIDIDDVTIELLKKFPRSMEIQLGPEMLDRKMIRVYSLFRSTPKIHIHIVKWECWCKSRERNFHMILQNDPLAALQYSQYKKKLIDEGVTDPKKYGELKDIFIRRIEQNAEAKNG